MSSYGYGEFDVQGRVKQSSQVTNGQTYSMSYDYNLAGAMTSETYPSGRVITTGYDPAGRISGVAGQKTGETARPYADSFGYWPSGVARNMRLGNQLWEHTEINNRLQITEIDLGTTQGGVDRLKLNNSYGSDQQQWQS